MVVSSGQSEQRAGVAFDHVDRVSATHGDASNIAVL
jgi:hypothetical protein